MPSARTASDRRLRIRHGGTERVDVIQKEFGHVSIETTHRYASIPAERQDELYKKINFALQTRKRRTKNRNGILGPESRSEENANNL